MNEGPQERFGRKAFDDAAGQRGAVVEAATIGPHVHDDLRRDRCAAPGHQLDERVRSLLCGRGPAHGVPGRVRGRVQDRRTPRDGRVDSCAEDSPGQGWQPEATDPHAVDVDSPPEPAGLVLARLGLVRRLAPLEPRGERVRESSGRDAFSDIAQLDLVLGRSDSGQRPQLAVRQPAFVVRGVDGRQARRASDRCVATLGPCTLRRRATSATQCEQVGKPSRTHSCEASNSATSRTSCR